MAESLFSYPTPFTPPTTEEDKLSFLRLIRSRRVGVATFYRLLAEHGSAAVALDALPEIARAAGVAQYAACPEGVALAEMKAARRLGAQMLCHGQPSYPSALAELSDAPPVLWAMGDVSLLTRPMVALVGARNASSLGTRMARKLAEGLGAAGYVVVSGLARGVDAAAHHAALASGTVAVQAGGVDVIYPAENTALAKDIAVRGLRLSEQPFGLEPQARHFPMRNRIISGLGRAVVVIEAAARSGSLITARNALDQGREVMAVPGHPLDARASGCNMLIRDGALLVRGVEDILAGLGCGEEQSAHPSVISPKARGENLAVTTMKEAPATGDVPPPLVRDIVHKSRPTSETRALHQSILDRLGPSPLAEDQLIRDLSLPAAKLAQELLLLEMDGVIARQPGGLLTRVV
ncbi:DNA-processing protein DprA [Phaeovulum sp.]|uniref:DNA-processing protein DprA n=1 Tax=Phaeovulum sp. TaxID=2934796 RepID=UPI0039E71B6C